MSFSLMFLSVIAASTVTYSCQKPLDICCYDWYVININRAYTPAGAKLVGNVMVSC